MLNKGVWLVMFLFIAMFTLLAAQPGSACTLTWNAPTTYSDGSPIASGEVVNYRVYFTPAGSVSTQKVADTTTPEATLVCPVGEYYVTAYSNIGAESMRSNSVTIKQLNKPVNLKWAN